MAHTPPGLDSSAPSSQAKSAEPAEVKTNVPSSRPAESVQGKGKGKASKGKAGITGPGEIAATGVQDKPYEIGPEDVLLINVLHQPDVSSQVGVRPDGFISVRFGGEIKAAGLTTQQLADVITEKLTQYFNHPEVNVQILRINSKKYYVSGEVKKPGAYALSTPKTILEAIIEAGGPTDWAKKKGIYILRGKDTKISFNFNDVSKGKHLEQNVLLQNGDVVVVP